MEFLYTVENRYYSELERNVKVPKYQRRLVWSPKQKQEFITNIHNGYPFGSVLLYRYGEEEQYSLVDGLQRFSTISEYKNNPASFFTGYSNYVVQILELIEEDARDRGTELLSSTKEQLTRFIEDQLKEHLQSGTEDALDLRERLCGDDVDNDAIPKTKKFTDAITRLQPFLKKSVEDYIDIDKLLIPCIRFTGEQSQLPEVFANLNQGGTKLSKYQVLAANWANYELKLSQGKNGNDILSSVIDRYNELNEKRSFDIEDFDRDEMESNRRINLSEFCFALGDVIISEAPVFWQSLQNAEYSSKEDVCNVIGYLSTAIALKVDNRKVAELVNRFDYFNDPAFTDNLVDAIRSTYRLLHAEFSRWLRAPGVDDSPVYESSAITDMQILSFFASLFHSKYHLNDETKRFESADTTLSEQIRKNLISNCVVDVVAGSWQGSGDSRLANYYIDDVDSPLSYRVSFDKDELVKRLSAWVEDACSKSSINIDKTSKLLLCIAVSGDRNNYSANRYDVEHIISRKNLKEKDAFRKGNIPGGNLGNLMYLKEKTNRGKGAANLYVLKEHEGFTMDEGYKEMTDYPDRSAIESIETALSQSEYQPAIDFIKQRAMDLVDKISEHIASDK